MKQIPRRIPVESHLAILCGVAALVLSFSVPWLSLGVAAGVMWAKARSRSRLQEALAPSLALGEEGAHGRDAVLVPIFSGEEPLEELIPLAQAVAGRGGVEVVRIGTVPDQTPFWAVAEQDERTRTRLRAVDGAGPATRFSGVLTRREDRSLPDASFDGRFRWVVIPRQPPSPWALLDPVTRFVASRGCVNVVAYRPAPEARASSAPDRALVFGDGGTCQAVLLQLARRLGASEVTVVHLADPQVTAVDVATPYERLAALDPSARLELVRSSDPLASLLELAQGFDLLLIGVAPFERARWLRPRLEDRLAALAPCAVVQVSARRPLPTPFAPLSARADEPVPATPRSPT